jgi:hypothetical protein
MFCVWFGGVIMYVSFSAMYKSRYYACAVVCTAYYCRANRVWTAVECAVDPIPRWDYHVIR